MAIWNSLTKEDYMSDDVCPKGDEYESQVVRFINGKIDSNWTSGRLTAAEALFEAHKDVQTDRERNIASAPYIVQRDAEYYLVSRAYVASQGNIATKSIVGGGGIVLNDLWSALKLAIIMPVQKAFHTTWGQSSPGRPNTDPSGSWYWVKKGAEDGKRDTGNAVAKPAYAKTRADRAVTIGVAG